MQALDDRGGAPFNKNFTPGHEYMGTVVALGPGVDEFAIGDRVTVEIHAGCGQCKRCRMGMYTSCLNYGLNYGDVDKGHRANGFTSDGGFAEFAVNNINTLIKIADAMSDEEATLVVTAGTAMYGLTELGGLIAGESVVVIGPGPIGLLGVAVAKALPAWLGTIFYRLETNVRQSTVLGMVGAGGIGFELVSSMKLFKYQDTATCILVILAMVLITDLVSSRIRSMIR